MYVFLRLAETSFIKANKEDGTWLGRRKIENKLQLKKNPQKGKGNAGKEETTKPRDKIKKPESSF